MILLKLTVMRETWITVESVDVEYRLFSDKEAAEKWLVANRFNYEHREFYKGDAKEWYHDEDKHWDFVNVDMIELETNDSEKYVRIMPDPYPYAEDREYLSPLIRYAVYLCHKANLTKDEALKKIKQHYQTKEEYLKSEIDECWEILEE